MDRFKLKQTKFILGRPPRALLGLLVAAVLTLGTNASLGQNPALSDTMYMQIMPSATELMPGDILDVDLIIPVAGLPFNAYDAYVSYDPEVFTFLRRPSNIQEGPLMKDACGLTFHLFSIAPDSTHLTINHSLLCAGMSLTGPGVVYRLQFECKDVDADTSLRLLRESPTMTRAFDDGVLVQPLVTIDADIRVGAGSVSSVPEAPANDLRLDAAPNPFNPQMVFTFALATATAGELSVYTLDGRRVRTLAGGHFDAGEHSVRWDGRDDRGHGLAAGVYLARLQTVNGVAAARVCLVK